MGRRRLRRRVGFLGRIGRERGLLIDCVAFALEHLGEGLVLGENLDYDDNALEKSLRNGFERKWCFSRALCLPAVFQVI
jgi:hypothetical protein